MENGTDNRQVDNGRMAGQMSTKQRLLSPTVGGGDIKISHIISMEKTE